MVIYVEFRFRPNGEILLSLDKEKLEAEVTRLKREEAEKKIAEAVNKLTF
jgi:hypothetical protein